MVFRDIIIYIISGYDLFDIFGNDWKKYYKNIKKL